MSELLPSAVNSASAETAIITNASYDTPINAGLTFTSDSTDVSPYATLVISCLTDKAGTITAEFSGDDTNWDIAYTYAITANVAFTKKISVMNTYYRVKVNNTALTNQTFIRLYTIAGSQQLDVTLSLDTAGIATDTLQTVGNASLASIDGKVTACNTGAVVVSTSALPTGAATAALQSTGNSSLASLDGKATTGNTSLGSLDTKATAANASLASLDGKVTACNTGAVIVSTSALPSGAATAALQSTGNTSLGNLDTKATAANASLSSLDGKVTACNTGAVVISTSALPAGAATAALQSTGNTSLSSLDTKATAANASLASLDGKVTACNTGAVVVSTSALPAGAATSSLQTTGNSALTSLDGKVTACNTGAVIVSTSALPAGAATSALQTMGNASLSNLDGKVTACNTGAVVVSTSALPAGAATATLQTTGNSSLTSIDSRLASLVLNTAGTAGTYSLVNATTTPLSAGATFTGTSEEVAAYGSVCITCKTDQAGSLYVDFSPDGTNWDSTLTFTVDANINEVHRITVSRRYYRCRMTNTSGAAQTFLRLQTLLGYHHALTSIVNSTIQTDADSLLTRSIITGRTSAGTYLNVPVDESGHLETAIHGPLLPFGSVHTESLIPVFQNDAVYGINTGQIEATSSLSGSATAADSLFTCSTGTTIYGFGSIQGKKRLRYRPGQGIVARFAGRFTTPVASSYQVMGVGHAEDGLYFGYKDTNFGILYNSRGVRECRTFTITVPSSTTESITVTLNGTAFTVTVTNSGNASRTAYEISRGTYAGWSVDVIDGAVIFLADSVGLKSGAFSVSGTTIAGTFAQTKAGAAVTETFIPQSSWNEDKLDGTGSSSIVADWTKGNVFQLGIQYLGFGTLTCKVETVDSSVNNATWTTVHIIKLPNTLTATSFRNPSFPFTMSAYSAGSTTNLSVYAGSFAGFIEGVKMLHGNRYSYYAQSVAITSGAYGMLFAIRNSLYFKGISNQSVINLISISAALKHTSPCIIYMVKNPIITGNVVFANFSANSCSNWSNTASMTVTWSDNDQLIWSGHLGDTGELDHHFSAGGLEDFTLQPGDSIAICAKATTGSPTYVTASINTREDQ